MSVKPSDIEILESLKFILQKGNSAEVKKENGNIVVIEIKRKLNIKRPLE